MLYVLQPELTFKDNSAEKVSLKKGRDFLR